MTAERMAQATERVAEWIRTGDLEMDVTTVPLRDIESVWPMDFRGRRVVIVPERSTTPSP